MQKTVPGHCLERVSAVYERVMVRTCKEEMITSQEAWGQPATAPGRK